MTENKSLFIYTLRKTFFDLIEDIQFPHKLVENFNFWSRALLEKGGTHSLNATVDTPGLSTVSFANGKIITTSQWLNFTLFSLEDNDWTESVVEFSGDRLPLGWLDDQLLTVRNLESKR